MFKAIGLVIGLIAFRVFMPEVFHAFEHTAISFFSLLDQVFAYAPNSIGQTGSVGSANSILNGANFVPSSAPLPAYVSSY